VSGFPLPTLRLSLPFVPPKTNTMGYAGYAPGHKVVELTVLQQLLKQIKSDKSLETLEKLTRNSAQAPGEEKFRKVRLTNEKIALVITNVPGAKESMVEMGWVESDDGENLVLPASKSVTMREVREIDAARSALRKLEDEEFKKRIKQRNVTSMDPNKKRLLAEMDADRQERAARGPVTKGSVATPKGDGVMQTAAGAGCSGTSGG